MSHRKVYSQGSIPFSWEDTPGVCKVTHHHDCRPFDIRLHALKLTSSQSSISPTSWDSARVSADHDMKIPLPPCPLLQPPRRSTSIKLGHELQEDPFLVAYKECTKSVETGYKPPPPQIKKGNNNIGFKLWKSKSIFSCKNSSEVIDQGNILNLSQLPPGNILNLSQLPPGNILNLSQLPPLPRFNASVSRRERSQKILWQHRSARDH